MKQYNFLDEDNRLSRLSKLGDPLETLSGAVDFELFRPLLNKIYGKEKDASKGGRPNWDYVLIFKILILQELNNIADERTEFLINDRLSFQRFLGLTLGSKVPDAKTIWLYKEILSKSGRGKELFDMFTRKLDGLGLITRQGSIVDATFADAPRQRNSREENEKIKSGEIPEEWRKGDKKSKNKLAQKDTEARWAKKGDETHFGYKDHVKVDRESKIITNFAVTDAAVHDSQKIVELIDKTDKVAYADSAYVGQELHEEIRRKSPNIELRIHEKAYRGKPLTQAQKDSNTEKSRVRARVEHIFGHMTISMGGITVRCIGIVRATLALTLKNLAYNINRFTYISRLKNVAVIS
jgi:IS5 family transposase